MASRDALEFSRKYVMELDIEDDQILEGESEIDA